LPWLEPQPRGNADYVHADYIELVERKFSFSYHHPHAGEEREKSIGVERVCGYSYSALTSQDHSTWTWHISFLTLKTLFAAFTYLWLYSNKG